MSFGGKGNSRANTQSDSTTNQTNITTTDNSVYTSDFGAVAAAKDISLAGIEAATDTINRSNDLVGDALSTTSGLFLDVSDAAQNLGQGAFNASYDNLNRGLGFAQDAYSTSTKFATDALGKSLDAVSDANATTRDVSESYADSVTDLVSSLFDFAGGTIDKSITSNASLVRSASESGDDRVTRLGSYAFLAIAAIMVLPALFGKK